MKVTMRLTLDGLVRAMRVKAHRVASRMESERRRPDGTRRETPRRGRSAEERRER